MRLPNVINFETRRTAGGWRCAMMARMPYVPEIREITTRDDVIRLGQFLKLADVVAAGSDAKVLLAEGAVSVNGEIETRRGRQLVKGDVVHVGPHQLRVG